MVELKERDTNPLVYPIYLHSLPQSQILDIILGKKIVKFTIDVEIWLQTFKDDGITYRWLSKKETSRINGKFKGNHGIFSLEGCGIELESNEGLKQNLGEGIFSRMFTSLNMPSSLKKYLENSFKSFLLNDLSTSYNRFTRKNFRRATAQARMERFKTLINRKQIL